MKPGLLITVTACASTTRAPAEAGSDGSLTRVRAAGELVVCSSDDVPSFYRDPKTGRLAGTDYGMIKVLADRPDIPKFEMHEVPTSGIIPALTAKRCDLISDNIAITVKRSQQVRFSAHTHRAGQALVVPKAPAGVQAWENFAGDAIGSYLGMIQLGYLKNLTKKRQQHHGQGVQEHPRDRRRPERQPPEPRSFSTTWSPATCSKRTARPRRCRS
ncbi:substrate-binding periplasmic protein [Nonomuraea zeae]|uniref:Transporter substrate-binding domain-containing protein n=1 Tax=Nonomuraea zeae TaxID=1642303 RepID=A0A5S4FUC8_9ACTN|nr:transporter substrate-binding domain-containing protein [Nonomuraea zeae]TMR24377.1 transporter substrate-binding domain-containing protein [Nonomuraea zeae]